MALSARSIDPQLVNPKGTQDVRRNPLLYSEPSEIVQSPAPLAHAAQEPPKKSSFFFYFIILLIIALIIGKWWLILGVLIMPLVSYFAVLYRDVFLKWNAVRKFGQLPKNQREELIVQRKMILKINSSTSL